MAHHRIARSPRFVSSLLLLAIVLVFAPVASAEAAIDGEAEADFLCRVNEARERAGRAPLRVADDLTTVARNHSRVMAGVNHLHHNPNLGSDVEHWSVLTENVGVGPSVDRLHQALMDSEGHRRNILDGRVAHIGVGVKLADGRLWVTQVFRKPTAGVSTRPVPCATTAAAGRPVVGDWDGDGRATPGRFRDGRWVLSNDLAGSLDLRLDFGRRGDVPVVGDWNGDGRDTIGIVRDGAWHLKDALSGGGSDRSFVYGRVTRGDVPLVGDWDGDGRDAIGIVRDGAWHLKDTLSGGTSDRSFVYGRVTRGDVPLVGDWNADGRDTIGIVRDGTWHLRSSLSGGRSTHDFVYGRVLAGDVPVIGDWSKDGVSTVGIVRETMWHLRHELAGGGADRSIAY